METLHQSHDTTLSIADIERLFVREAALLDDWKLLEWLELLTEDAQYLVPPLDVPHGDPATTLFLVADTHVMLKSRVEQLLGRVNWAENPRSRTRRLVTNFRMLDADGAEPLVAANFAVWQFAAGQVHTFVGHYEYRLRRVDGAWRIGQRRAVLDMQTLRPHGKLSFIL